MNKFFNLEITPAEIGDRTVDIMHQNAGLGASIMNSMATSCCISAAVQLSVIHNLGFTMEDIAEDKCAPLHEIFDTDGNMLEGMQPLFDSTDKIERAENSFAIFRAAMSVLGEVEAVWEKAYPERVVNGRRAQRPRLQYGRKQMPSSQRWTTLHDPKTAIEHYYRGNRVYKEAVNSMSSMSSSGSTSTPTQHDALSMGF